RSLGFKREMRYGWAQVGDRLEERFTLTNQFILPATWVAVHDQSTLPDHHSSVATGVDGNSTSQWKVLNQCTRRGVFRLGGTKLETGDPLGVYTLTLEDPTSATLAVMPPIVALPRFHILTSGWAGEGRTNPRSLEETLNASHTREMAPGDPLKLIHWKTTARKNTYHVRQADGTPAGDRWILLDLHGESQVGTGWGSTEEHGVILASSLINQGLNEDRSVGLAVNGNEPAWHVPRRNEYQQRSLLKSLAVASPSGMELKDYLHRTNKAFGSRCSLLIITACADAEWTQSLLPLMWRGVLPTVFLFDVNTFGGQANTQQLSSVLGSLGVPCHVIPKELLDKPQARPGHEGEWEWRISGTGKAILVSKPADDWRGLG
ncbi:MAG: DUF58 domain-containing protein, partial [Anaerolineales bacterium]|nr:DUF58 domain-containing protein [Anaerolineales bacterium]